MSTPPRKPMRTCPFCRYCEYGEFFDIYVRAIGKSIQVFVCEECITELVKHLAGRPVLEGGEIE